MISSGKTHKIGESMIDNKTTLLLESLTKALEKSKETKDLLEVEEIVKNLVSIDYYYITHYMEQNNKTVLDMIEEYGVYWPTYEEPIMCPHCCENLMSKDGPPFKKEIPVVNYELGIIEDLVCPDCYHSILNDKEYNEEFMENSQFFDN